MSKEDLVACDHANPNSPTVCWTCLEEWKQKAPGLHRISILDLEEGRNALVWKEVWTPEGHGRILRFYPWSFKWLDNPPYQGWKVEVLVDGLGPMDFDALYVALHPDDVIKDGYSEE